MQKIHGKTPISKPILYCLTGAMMLGMDSLYSAINQSFFAEESVNASRNYIMTLGQYETDGQNPILTMLTTGQLKKLIGFLYIVGLYSFIKGIYLIKDSANPNQRNPVQRAIIHISYGVAMMNVKRCFRLYNRCIN